MAQCTAKAKSTGTQCTRRAMDGTTVCYVHGGPGALKSRGANNANFVHGRRSKYYPKQLAQKVQEAASDPDLLNHRDELILIDVLMADALERVNADAGYSQRLWKDVRKEVQNLEVHVRKNDISKIYAETYVRLRDLADEGLKQAETRVELRELAQERSKIGEREMKRRVAMQNMMTAEQSVMLIESIRSILRETITDPKTRAELEVRFATLEGHVA